MSKYVTKQRKILKEYLCQHIDKELSAKEVAANLESEGISLSAVYRNLAEMQEEKSIVQCHKKGSREFYFRYVETEECKNSIHLTCKICSKTEHLSEAQSTNIISAVKENLNFLVDLTESVFYGICNDCRNCENE